MCTDIDTLVMVLFVNVMLLFLLLIIYNYLLQTAFYNFKLFFDRDLDNLTKFLHSNVVPFTPQPHCEELVRGR